MFGQEGRLSILTATALWIGVVVTDAGAQSLADVARRAGATPASGTGRVITNADLPAAGPAEPPSPMSPAAAAAAEPATSAATTASAEKTPEKAPAGAPAKAREKRPEQYWRGRARDLQGRLARIEADVAGMASRLDAIDAGPATPAARQERAVTAAALARLRTDERYLRDELAQFEARARGENVPDAWLR